MPFALAGGRMSSFLSVSRSKAGRQFCKGYLFRGEAFDG